MVPNAGDARPGEGRDGGIAGFSRFLGKPGHAF